MTASASKAVSWKSHEPTQLMAWMAFDPEPPELSAGRGKKSRPGLDRILERLDRRDADGIVVSNLDRLSRLGVTDALELITGVEALAEPRNAPDDASAAATAASRILRATTMAPSLPGIRPISDLRADSTPQADDREDR